jgi:predicted transcriptional regulator
MKEVMGRFDELLSPLEADVLRVLWPDKKMKVRQMYDLLKHKRKVALSSVAVILDRLHARGIVNRTVETARGGMRYTYFPRQDKKQFEQNVVETAVNKLIDAFGPTAVSYFNERFGRKK